MASERPKPYIKPMNLRARTVRSQPKGLPVINLSFNELPFGPSDAVLRAIEQSSKNAHCYGSPACDELRTALADRHELNAEQIICGNGSEELLDIIGRCFAASGDEIVISEYGYIQFSLIANRVGAKLIKAREQNYVTHIEALLEAVTSKTRILFLANPNNPTGTMIDSQALNQLAMQLPHNIVLVIDLAYGEFANDHYCACVQRLVDKYENIIITRTFSKAYGLAGLRAGWCYAPEWMIPTLNAARGMGTVNAVAQAGALAALSQKSINDSQIARIINERQRMSDAVTKLGLEVVPSSTNFLMVSIDRALESSAVSVAAHQSDELANHLFDDAGIIVNRTRESGLEKFIRFSISLPQHNDLLINSLDAFFTRPP